MKKIIYTITILLLLPTISLAVNEEQPTTTPAKKTQITLPRPNIQALYPKSLPPEVARVQARKKGKTLIIRGKSTPQSQLNFYYPRTKYKKRVRLAHDVVYPGSLKVNIKRIARHFGWSRVAWTVPNDYNWVGVTRIQGEGLPGILRKLLKNYPVQAVFYQGNRVLLIRPRTLQ